MFGFSVIDGAFAARRARACGALALLLTVTGRAHASPPPSASNPALMELALGESVLAPAGYTVSIADTSLAAGTGIGSEIAVRLLALSGWVIGAQVSSVRRSSRDSGLSASRFWQLGLELDRRVPLADILELRVGVRAGYDLLVFDDADAVTKGLGLAALLGLHLRIAHAVWLEMSGGALGQPIGGNGATGLTLPPTAFAILGFCVAAPYE